MKDLIRDLNLSKDKAELLRSLLEQKNLLNETVRISYHNREKDLAKIFSDEDGLIYCSDVNKLIKAVGHKKIASEWRLFIDLNKTSLKGVFLHNGNEFPSIPVANASQCTLLVNLFRLQNDCYSVRTADRIHKVLLLLMLLRQTC